jgi:hypothetical protein
MKVANLREVLVERPYRASTVHDEASRVFGQSCFDSQAAIPAFADDTKQHTPLAP